MMKAQSDTIPESFVKSNGKTQVNYNILPVSKTDEKGTRTVFEYDYVEINGVVTNLKVLEALQKAEDELKPLTISPDAVVQQHIGAKDILDSSVMQELSDSASKITDIAGVKAYLKKLSTVMLVMVGEQMGPRGR